MSLIQICPKNFDVIIHMAYATANNFTQQVIYDTSLCYLHSDAISPLEKAIDLAKRQGVKFKILDAYRPQSAQEFLWDLYPNSPYIADPKKGSHHTRGIALDLTLVDATTLQEIPMGTDFDSFCDKSHHGSLDMDDVSMKNRLLLLGIMMSAGWDFYQKEWWHYQLFNPYSYPLIHKNQDDSFSEQAIPTLRSLRG
jgi:D-alanyl-D-alanine dipeptidase